MSILLFSSIFFLQTCYKITRRSYFLLNHKAIPLLPVLFTQEEAAVQSGSLRHPRSDSRDYGW